MKPQELKRIRTQWLPGPLTQAQLAEIPGVDRNTVARWEMGLHPIPPMVQKLISCLWSKQKE